MNIVIVGIGKVGLTLVEQLSKEGHDIIVIDNQKNVIENVINDYDVMGVLGNGANYDIQTEARVPDADLFIASTSTDELNILCCMVAKKLGAHDTIARIRNPEYFTLFMDKELGLNLMVNPEYEGALEINRILRSPAAIKIEPFANGKVDLIELKLNEDSPMINIPVHSIFENLQLKILVCAVQRGDDVFIPNGNSILEKNDKIYITACPHEMYAILKKLGIYKSIVKNVMIIGGGKISFYLAKELEKIGVHVKIVEKDKEKCIELNESLEKAEIIFGDGSDHQILLDEGIEKTGAIIILTGSDEENIMISLFANSVNVKKIVTKINRVSYYSMLESSGIESIISPRLITANHIIRFVRGRQNSMGSSVLNLYKIVNNKAEALEFVATNTFKGKSIPLKDIELKENIIIANILRNNTIISPTGEESIEDGDKVIIVTTNEFLDDLNDILK